MRIASRLVDIKPSITLAVTPQPAAQSGHTLGFQTAIPGVSSSSGMKRTIWFSGLPQLVAQFARPQRHQPAVAYRVRAEVDALVGQRPDLDLQRRIYRL